MTVYYRPGFQPAPLPEVYTDSNNNTFTNLGGLSESELNTLGFYKADDAPAVADTFLQSVAWSTDTNQWVVSDNNYAKRNSIFTGQRDDHVNQWNKIKKTFELRLLTLDYASETEKQTIINKINWVKQKVTSLNSILYQDFDDASVEGVSSDAEYNAEAMAFLNDEPVPRFNRIPD